MCSIMPNAKKNEVIGCFDDALKIRLQAQPVEGKANEGLIRYMADMLDVPKKQVKITHGHTSKRKTLEIDTERWTVEGIRQRLVG